MKCGAVSARLSGLGLRRGPVLGPFDGQSVEVWLRDGVPRVAVLAGGDPEDRRRLHRIAWSLGCPWALAPGPAGTEMIETAGSPTDPVPARVHDAWPDDFPGTPAGVPGVVRALVRLGGVWRERLLRRCLAGHHDWTETGLNLAVERPLAEMLLGTGSGAADTRMRAELGAAGVVHDAVPSDLIALAWDLHLARGVRLSGADASVGDRPPAARAGSDRAVLRQFAAWAGTDADGVERMLVPACGAGRLLLECGGWAGTHNIHLCALDPDPRAVLFATALVGREFGSRLACTIQTAHPLVEADLYDDPLARLIPEDARARLRPADWPSLFGGVECFDRVLIGDPAVPLTRRTAVQRYVEGRYTTAGGGTDPALLLVEAGTRHLALGGSVLALYPAAAYRAPTAAAFRRWLGARAEALVAMPGYCAVRVSAAPLATPLLAGGFGEGETVLRSYPRSALDPASWTVTDPDRAALFDRLDAGGAPLGDVLLGGVRAPALALLDPALLIDARDRLLLLRADRRAARAIRPVIAPGDVVRFGSTRAASRFVIAGPLPRRARRLALELGLAPPETDPFSPPSGPRLLFAEGARTPAFLCDPDGRAVTTAGVSTIAPSDLFLVGLLHAGPVTALIAARCPGGLSARCLARLPVRLPDPYDEGERAIGEEIAALTRQRLAVGGSDEPDAQTRRRELEAAIDRAVERLYKIPSA